MKLYTYKAVDSLIEQLIEKGYEAIQLREGTLGSGDWVLLSHDPTKYNFVVREVALNEWNSAHNIRRTAKISKALQKEIDKARAA